MGEVGCPMDRTRLRARAEAELRQTSNIASAGWRHEINVYETMLSLQGEELERSLRDLELASARYFLLFDVAPIPFVVIDPEGLIVEINAAAARLLRTSRSRSIGSWFERFVSGQDLTTYHESLRSASEASGLDTITLDLQLGDTTIPARAQIVPLVEPQDGYLISIIDLSRLRRAQARLDTERQRVEAIFDAAVDAIITTNADGLINAFNPAAESMFGHAAADVTGRPLRSLLPSLPSLAELPGERGAGRELVARRRDGSEFPAHLSIARLRGTGAGFCVFVRDLTEVKKVEQELRHAHKMEAIGTLASGVAHDFNNLLMGVTGCTEIALETLESDSIARMYLEEVIAAASAGIEITRQLLTFSRREKELSAGIFELNELIAQQINMLSRLIGEDVELRLDLAAEDSRIRADPGQITQILMNLAINARDAMPEGGLLQIGTELVDLEAEGDRPAGRYVALRVADTGCGMPESVRRQVFDPFYTNKKLGRGTGLGLSTVYGTVKQAQGSISIDSQEGQGTSFEILLPLSERRVTRDFAPVRAGQLEGGDETILVVEDDARVRMVLRSYLEAGGYTVLEATGGQAAIDCCRNYPRSIDLVVTDMVLPQMSGDRIAAELETIRPGIPVVYISAHDPEWLRKRGPLSREGPVLQKPLGASTLLPVVRRLLDSESTPPAQSSGTVLVVEDCSATRLAITELLRLRGWQVLTAASSAEASEQLESHRGDLDVLLIDLNLPDAKGDRVARTILEKIPGAKVVYMTGHRGVGAIEPAGTVLEKPVDLNEIAQALADV